jgi:integrase/recombinase XerD
LVPLARAGDVANPVDEYLAWLKVDRHASAHTVAAYRRDLGRFVAVVEGHGLTQITEVDPDLLRAYQRARVDS